jgi:hypothetical protein
MEIGEFQRAAEILQELDKDVYYQNEKMWGVKAMMKAFYGLALKNIKGEAEQNKSLLLIEEAKQLRKRLGPVQDPILQMHLPLWTLYDSELDKTAD